MSSRQLNFFILESDLPMVLTFLKANGSILVRNNISKIEKVFTVEDLLPEGTSGFQLFFTNLENQDKVYFTYSDGQRRYYVDVLKSNVAVLSFGGIYHQHLYRSRLYVATSFFADDDKSYKKDTEFIEWTSNVFKTFKRTFLHTTGVSKSFLFSKAAGELCSDDATELREGGLKLYSKHL